MNRDGALKSIWQDEVPDYGPVNVWNSNKLYDVLVVGGGITGLTTALLLSQQGKNCILAEASNIGFGTSSGTTCHLNTMLDTPYHIIEKDFGRENARLVAKAAREAIDLIEQNINRYNIDCDFSYETGYLLAQNEEETEELGKIKDAFNTVGESAGWTEHQNLILPYIKAAGFKRQAQMHPLKYLVGLASAFEKEGGIILQDCIVSNIEPGQHFVAETSIGQINAQFVVYATHIPPGINLLHFRCAPYRSYAAAFTLTNQAYPGGLMYDMKDPYHYFRTQIIDDKTYIIGGGFDHKTGHNDNTDYTFTELEAYLRTYFNIGQIDFKWSSQYFQSADGLPYIGWLPGNDNILTATGFGGNGIIFGSIAGRIMSDMLLQIKSPYTDVFDPNRIKPIAGFTNFVKENADVISQFIGKRFSYEQINELAALAPGEATLAEWEGKKLALYKDENGKVQAFDPVCPHARCLVSWNSAEKSWDCGCHGSRFGCNGGLLAGPSRVGLTPIHLLSRELQS